MDDFRDDNISNEEDEGTVGCWFDSFAAAIDDVDVDVFCWVLVSSDGASRTHNLFVWLAYISK